VQRAAEEMERIFEPFYRFQAQGERWRLGLGLSLVRSIAHNIAARRAAWRGPVEAPASSSAFLGIARRSTGSFAFFTAEAGA